MDSSGRRIESLELSRLIEEEQKDWNKGITFPALPCEVPCLRLTDIAPFASVKDYTERYGTSVAFLGATMIADDREILEEAFPGIKENKYPYPTRRIKQLALIEESAVRGIASLVGGDGKLVTHQLEDLGVVLVFCGTKREAKDLYRHVHRKHKTCYLAIENDKEVILNEHVTSLQKFKSSIAYTRGALGKGVNLENVRTLVINADAYRPISSFTPGQLTPEEFDRARSRERSALIMQNVGRVLRGEAGKTACVILLNADNDLIRELQDSPAIQESSTLAPVFAQTPGDLEQLVDQCYRWLHAEGGIWPEPDPSKAKTAKPRGRRSGRKNKTAESVFDEAKLAFASGVALRDFWKKNHPDRHLNEAQLSELRALFRAT
jgi:hypothetical protein